MINRNKARIKWPERERLFDYFIVALRKWDADHPLIDEVRSVRDTNYRDEASERKDVHNLAVLAYRAAIHAREERAGIMLRFHARLLDAIRKELPA